MQILKVPFDLTFGSAQIVLCVRFLPVIGALPRTLHVLEFAQARAQEIQALSASMTTLGGNRRIFQTMPRHLRRRSMSHNVFRMPYRLRAQAQQEVRNRCSSA